MINEVRVGDLVFRLRKYEDNIDQYEQVCACTDLHGDIGCAMWLFSDVMELVDCKGENWVWAGCGLVRTSVALW